jgi:hypothetical protein
VIPGTAGDGVTAGGYMVVSSFVPLVHTATQTSVSADLYEVGTGATSGSRQQPNTTNDSCPFYLDLVNAGGHTWAPAVTLYDSGAASAANAFSADASGETPRFSALWAAVSATTSGQISYTANGVYSWTAPNGVTSATVTAAGAGAGGGAGNVSGGGTEFGGGGGGGGEDAQGTVAVTPGNVYAPTVGAGGAGGAEPGGGGTAGGDTVFAGDVANVTGHGASSGAGASVSGNGAGGAGGTGAGGTHFDGGAGAAGSTARYGGGGGSSAGTAAAGNPATTSAGATAPAGGGPGGAGGGAAISIVQSGSGHVSGNVNLTLSFKALQAGNTIIICTGNQARPTSGDPTVTLNDGTALSSVVTSDGPNITNGIFAATNVTGGQTSATVTYIHQTTVITMGQFFEVAGLGPSPGNDGTGNATHNSQSSWTVSTATSGAPDLWIGSIAADSGAGSFTLNPSGAWTKLSQTGATVGAVSGAMRSGYQIVSSTGTATWSGSITGNLANTATTVAAFTSAAPTGGAAPLSTPGGGGGGGLGAANGGAGLDGSLTLTWTGQSGGGYGTPPVPTPYANWGATTRVGTAGDAAVDVDLNSSSGITGVVNFLSNPPIFRIAGTAAQSITSATLTSVAFTGAAATVDSYSGYSAGTYTIARAGLYLFHGLVAFASASGGTRQAGVTVNGTTYWGPGNLPTTAGTCNVTKTQVFSLQAGDTVQLACRQDKGSPVALSTTDSTRMFLVWLNASGTPSTLWTPPDATYRWVSGTPVGALPALFQQHLANDLGFLCQGPYLLAYQAAAQSGLAASAFATITMDTVGGIVHSDTGDNYSGWASGASNVYTAQQPGWYLYCAEYFLTSSAASGATAVAAVLPSKSGGVSPLHTPDSYQRLTATATASVGAGCTALGLYYLLAGETLTPQAEGLSYSGTFGTLTGTSNSGTYASHCEIIWVSN